MLLSATGEPGGATPELPQRRFPGFLIGRTFPTTFTKHSPFEVSNFDMMDSTSLWLLVRVFDVIGLSLGRHGYRGF